MFNLKKGNIGYIIYPVIFLLIGFFVGWYFALRVPNTASISGAIRENSAAYKFINPILLSGDQDESQLLQPLVKSISNAISAVKQKQGSSIDTVSVYFRDMNTGHWTGINEDLVYAPSSMLKVVMLVGYLKDGESEPSLFNKKLTYEANKTGQHYPPTHVLQNGQHSVTELLRAMIIDSDNAALSALFSNNREAFINVLKSLHIPPPPTLDTLDFMSPKTFSGIFRALYNGTYLSRPSAEAALGIMSATSFTKGIVAGVPTSVVVAHKFGEHTQNDPGGNPKSRELHDCGIVYYPTKPYFLCVMTRGGDFGQLESVISTVSHTAYDYVSTTNN